MVECPKCGSYAVEAYLYKEKEEVYYGHHCLICGLKSSEFKENDPSCSDSTTEVENDG